MNWALIYTLTFVEPVNQKIAQHSKNCWKSSKICRGNMSSIPSSRLQCRIYRPKRVIHTNNPWLSSLKGIAMPAEPMTLLPRSCSCCPNCSRYHCHKLDCRVLEERICHLCERSQFACVYVLTSWNHNRCSFIEPYTSESCHSPITVCDITFI